MKKMIFTIIWGILAVACLAYGIRIKAAGSGSSFFAIWLVGGLFFVGLSVAAYLHVWSRMNPLGQRLILAGIGILLVLFVFVESRILSCFNDKGSSDLDAVVVLGAQIYDRGPSIVLKYRLDTAAEYLKENPETVCVVSGGQGYNEPYPESQGMKKYLVDLGIEESRILEEPRSMNTLQNLEYSMQVLKDNGVEATSVGIITNNFHVYRALLIARKQGIENVEGIAASSTKLFLPNNMLREFLAVIKNAILGAA